MKNSKIRWTDHSWNAVLGCSKVSEGCRFCYAEGRALKFKLTPKEWTANNAAENVILKPHKLDELEKKYKEPSLIFVNSMSDFFHDQIPDDYLDRMMLSMIETPRHTYQILTKREERMRDYLSDPDTPKRLQGQTMTEVQWPLPQCWFGVSIESPKWLSRLDILRETPSHIRFLSCEPLLEDLGELDLSGIHWVIVGGESDRDKGRQRPMDHAWARSIRDECVKQGVEFYFKQSSARFTEHGKSLIEEDGSRTVWEYYPIDGSRYHDLNEVTPLPYRFDGYYTLPDEMRDDLDFDDDYLDKLDGNLIDNILERGKILKKWQEKLANHYQGTFQAWIKERRQYSKVGAYRHIWAYESFEGCSNVGTTFTEPSAVYALSAPKCPPQARAEAIQRAESGETITHKLAKEIIKAHTPQVPEVNFSEESEWTESEIERRNRVLNGETILANLHHDKGLIAWAESQGLAVRIDRKTDWGNPFVVGEDGTREEVIEWFKEYFGHKRSLHSRLDELRGKVLLCWCYPEPCHGRVLVTTSRGDT